MALRSLHCQLVVQVCAQKKRALQIQGNARDDPELANISGEIQKFSVCKGSNCTQLRGLLSMQGLRML